MTTDTYEAMTDEALERRAEEHGRLIKRRRLDLGLKRPAFVAEIAKLGQDMTADYLNKLEAGTRHLSNVSPVLRDAMRVVLGFSREEWIELTGLYTPDFNSPNAEYYAGQLTKLALKHRHDDVTPVPNVHRVPVVGMAAAGHGVDVSEVEPITYDYVGPVNYRPHMLILQVDGDSMSASGEVNTLQAGDWIYVDPRLLDLQDNKIFVVYVPGQGVLVKRVRQWPQGWMLTSDNNAYPPFSADEAQIIGRVYYRQPQGERL